jgi:ketosteroid isomerase-like protein
VDRAFRDFLDEQFETHLPAGYPEGEPIFRGRDGFAQLITMLRDAWAEWRFEPQRFIEAGDRVVVFVRVVAKGGASGVPIELEDAHVHTMRNGRIRSTRVYRDRSDALEAVGLRE